jgi:hypothetical protein
MLRALHRIQGKEDIEDQISNLYSEKKRIKREFDQSKLSRLREIEIEIDRLLFCPDIVSVVIEDNRHYQHMIERKLFINNRPFKRLLCGAGNARRNSVIFIAEEFEKPLKTILSNGRSNIPIAPAKYNAYFSLTASASWAVSTPYFCVIPDCLVTRTERVDFIEEDDPDDHVVIRDMDVEFNLFDGMGIVSPRQAEVWAGELGLDYIPSTFIIRSAFMKGMVVVIDFHQFSEMVGKHHITDIWGHLVNIRDMDVVITESQLKLWNAYGSCNEYTKKLAESGIGFGISRFSPKQDKKYVFSNYQFLQVLNLSDEQIKSLCKKTVDFFNKAIHTEISYALLYLLGKNANQPFEPDIFDHLHDTVTKALILNNALLEDPYVQNYLTRSLNKKIRESYIGNLLMDGNYQAMVSDPYAFMEHMFGLPVNGLLSRYEHYSQYWNKKGVSQVAACRAPLTWESEVNILNLQHNEELDYWFSHLQSGIIYNVHGNDVMLQADSDWDGDLVMTTDQEEFLDGARGGYPVTYTKNKVGKEIIDENRLHEPDMLAFNSHIGYITNCSTTLYAMLPRFEEDTEEYDAIIERLKICRKEQGNEIDKAKGLVVKSFPRHWTRWNKRGMDFDDDQVDFYNTILINKRPYFMRWLYADYAHKYRTHRDKYDLFSLAKFGRYLPDVLDSPTSGCEVMMTERYLRFAPLLDTPCLMNKICHHMEESVHELKEGLVKIPTSYNILILKDASILLDKEKYKKLDKLFRKYKSGKRNFAAIKDEKGEEKFKTLEQYNKSIRMEAIATISANPSELANLALAICYEQHPRDNKSFLWNVFGEGVVDNVMKNRQTQPRVPFLDEGGNILYLDAEYSLFDIDFDGGEKEFDDYI